MITEKRSIRLSSDFLRVVENVQDQTGQTFTGALKHIILEYEKRNQIIGLLQEIKIMLTSDNEPQSMEINVLRAILDDHEEFRSDHKTFKEAFQILGKANVASQKQIGKLFSHE